MRQFWYQNTKAGLPSIALGTRVSTHLSVHSQQQGDVGFEVKAWWYFFIVPNSDSQVLGWERIWPEWYTLKTNKHTANGLNPSVSANRAVCSSKWEYSGRGLFMVALTDFSTSYAEVIIRVKWLDNWLWWRLTLRLSKLQPQFLPTAFLFRTTPTWLIRLHSKI